jgi:hypothetical protein
MVDAACTASQASELPQFIAEELGGQLVAARKCPCSSAPTAASGISSISASREVRSSGVGREFAGGATTA